MTSALLIGTVLAAEVLFKGATYQGSKPEYAGNIYSKSWIANHGGANTKDFGGYGTLCDLGYWDAEDFSAENSYFIKSGKVATIGATGCTDFTAPNLNLGVKDNTSGWVLYETIGSPTVTLPEVAANFGGMIVMGTDNGVNSEVTVNSPKITVDCSFGNPFEIFNYYRPRQGVKFLSPFYGPATSLLKVYQWDNAKSTYGAYTYFAGDMSNFLGLIQVGRYHTLVLDANSKPNRVKMNQDTELWCGKTKYQWYEPVVVDELLVTNNVRVKISASNTAGGSLKVKSNLALDATNGEKLMVDLFVGSVASLPYYCGESLEWTLLDLPASAGELAETAVISNVNNSQSWPYLTFKDESNLERSVLKAVMPKRTVVEKLPPTGVSSLEAVSCWNSIQEGESLEDYLLIGKYTTDSRANSMVLKKSSDPNCTETFNGILLLGSELYLAQYCHEEFADLRLLPGAKWSVNRNATSNVKLGGVITVYDDGVNKDADGYPTTPDYFYFGYDATTLTIDAMIKGRGYLAFAPWTANYPGGTFVLTGNNFGFSGRLDVSHRDSGKKMTLKVSEAVNLGGPLDRFLKDAVRVGNLGVLEATDSFLLDEPTRGINVLGGGTIKVDAEKTMSIASTLTLSGAATKSGAGTLELCGTVVTENDATLAVTEGALKATTCTALSGCAVNFSDGAALTVDGDSFDDEYLAKGINLASTTLTTGDELLVKIESIQAIGPNRKVAIATDANAKAAELAAKLTAKLVLASGSEKSCAVSCEANEDGVTSTIWADCTRKGTILIVK